MAWNEQDGRLYGSYVYISVHTRGFALDVEASIEVNARDFIFIFIYTWLPVAIGVVIGLNTGESRRF